MTNTLHFSEWRNCIRAQRKVNLCAPGAPKGPKVGMVVRQYEMLCANDAGRAPRKYPGWWSEQNLPAVIVTTRRVPVEGEIINVYDVLVI